MHESAVRLTEMTLPDADGAAAGNDQPIFNYTYDLVGNLASEWESHTTFKTNYYYDDLYRLTEVKEPSVLVSSDPTNPGSTFERPSTTNEYDQGGNLVLTVNPLGNETRYEYDDLRRTIKTIFANPTTGDATGSAVV